MRSVVASTISILSIPVNHMACAAIAYKRRPSLWATHAQDTRKINLSRTMAKEYYRTRAILVAVDVLDHCNVC